MAKIVSDKVNTLMATVVPNGIHGYIYPMQLTLTL